jgi:hypothetical protein
MATNVQLTDRHPPKSTTKPQPAEARRRVTDQRPTRARSSLRHASGSPTESNPATALRTHDGSTVSRLICRVQDTPHSCFRLAQAASHVRPIEVCNSAESVASQLPRRAYSFVAGTCPSGKYPHYAAQKCMELPLFEHHTTKPPIRHSSRRAFSVWAEHNKR